MIVIASSLASPLASSAFAKDRPDNAKVSLCVCPPDCTHSSTTMDPDCKKHKCCKKMGKERDGE